MSVKKRTEFRIVNRRSKKALQPAGLENGCPVEQAEIEENDAQLWFSVETEQGFKFVNKASGKVLDVMENGMTDGTRAQLWEDAPGESQFWQTVTVRPYFKTLIHKKSGKVLDIAGISAESGAPAQLWENAGGENQQWRFVSAERKKTETVKKTSVKPRKKS